MFETPLTVSKEKGVAYKHIEDRVDAALCAYLAALAWLFGDSRLEMIGCVDEGYVVVPRASAECKFGCCRCDEALA